jgi:hypothetical protein
MVTPVFLIGLAALAATYAAERAVARLKRRRRCRA